MPGLMSERISLVPSLTPNPMNSATLIPASYPIIRLDYQCNSYETVRETVANDIQNDLVTGQICGGCCTTRSNNCSLPDVITQLLFNSVRLERLNALSV